jgi:hypothetical protein
VPIPLTVTATPDLTITSETPYQPVATAVPVLPTATKTPLSPIIPVVASIIGMLVVSIAKQK